MPKYSIANVSWGKDSLFMLLGLIARCCPLDEVVFYNTGMEFQAIYDTRDSALPLLQEHGIKYTELKPEHDFVWEMLDRPVNSKKNGFHYGYSWCGGRCRWGTTNKTKSLDIYAAERDAIVYVGIAVDETKRLEKDRKPHIRLPLVEWGYTEAVCLQGCYDQGFMWMENGFRLYDLLDRVSCWCCKNKNLKELRNIFLHLPGYWERLEGLQARTERPMKGIGKSVFDLKERFACEKKEDTHHELATHHPNH